MPHYTITLSGRWHSQSWCFALQSDSSQGDLYETDRKAGDDLNPERVVSHLGCPTKSSRL